MHWARVHAVAAVLIVVLAELLLLSTLGSSTQYAPSILTAHFQPYELALVLPLASAGALGAALRRVPAQLSTVTVRWLEAHDLGLAMICISLKVGWCAVLAFTGSSLPVGAYLTNTVLFMALTSLPRAVGRRDLWLPVLMFYLVMLVGVAHEGPFDWALTARTDTGAGHAVLAAGSFAVLVGAHLMPPLRRQP